MDLSEFDMGRTEWLPSRRLRLAVLYYWLQAPLRGCKVFHGAAGGRGDMQVDDSRDKRSPANSVPDVANPGIVRPPFVYVASIVLGLALHLLWPARLALSSISTPVGATVTVMG